MDGQVSVAEHVVSLCERDKTRVVITSRSELLAAIFELADRLDAQRDFLSKVCVRARKLLRDELHENYIPLAQAFPDLCFKFLNEDGEQQKQMRRYSQKDRESWEAVVQAVPKIEGDSRFT